MAASFPSFPGGNYSRIALIDAYRRAVAVYLAPLAACMRDPEGKSTKSTNASDEDRWSTWAQLLEKSVGWQEKVLDPLDEGRGSRRKKDQ